jgi:hypothetical protein
MVDTPIITINIVPPSPKLVKTFSSTVFAFALSFYKIGTLNKLNIAFLGIFNHIFGVFAAFSSF